MAFELPSLPYAFDALEPHIDARTMEIHHGKHHQAYVTKANEALAGTPMGDWPVEKVLAHLNEVPEKVRGAVRNNAGGHANHALFWTVMAPAGQGGEPSPALGKAIMAAFGTMDAFKEAFANAAATRFGSGWAWLYVEAGQLKVGSTPNQDSPLMGQGVAGIAGTPILGLDVWEHAYYLNYQNRRPDYAKAFWNIVNWKRVSELFESAKG